VSSPPAQDWATRVCNLVRAVGIARDAHRTSRRPKANLTVKELDRVRGCELEIARSLAKARTYTTQAASAANDEQDQSYRLVLELLRAHSLVWESLFLRYDGLPRQETGSGLEEAGSELQRYLIEAFEALKACKPDLLEVDWNGREIFRNVSY